MEQLELPFEGWNYRRPHRNDASILEWVKDKTIEILTIEVRDWCIGHGENEEYDEQKVKRDLSAVIKDHDAIHNGYELAKELEYKYSWIPDGKLVAILEQTPQLMEAFYLQRVEQWVKDCNIAPQFKVGDKVGVAALGTIFEGVIHEINTKHAQYMVRVDALKNRIDGEVTEGKILGFCMDFEQVEIMPADVQRSNE